MGGVVAIRVKTGNREDCVCLKTWQHGIPCFKHASEMSIHLEDIHPLTDFQRHAKKHLAQVNKTGRPQVLTVNGRAEAVLLGKKSYEKLMQSLEELETLKSIRRGLEDMNAGRTVSASFVHEKLRKL
jgi:prevent-host-death family protein